ncbi:MAG: adenylate/guanylate cyclase domain-containing protein [Anaeromyxobacteraceae bacterium]
MTPASVRKLRAALGTGLAVGLAAAAVAWLRPAGPEAVERLLYDVRARSAAAAQRASPGIVLVGIDDATVALAGGVYPLPRSALAAILDEAARAGARVVALDVLLVDPLEGSLADENAALEDALRRGRVVLAAAASRDAAPGSAAPAPAGETVPARWSVVRPLPRFERAAIAIGGVTQDMDADGRVRALRHVYPTAAGELRSLPLEAARLALGDAAVSTGPGRLRVGTVEAPVQADGRVLLRWLGAFDGNPDPASVYPQVSAADLLRASLAREGEGTPPAAEALAPLRDAVVVVSVTVTAGKDKRPTPVNAHAVGAELVATAIDGFLRGAFVTRATPLADAAAALGVALLAALTVGLLALASIRPAVTAALSTLGVAGLVSVGWLASSALLARGVWLAAGVPLAGGVLSALAADLRMFAAERRDRRFIHDALGRYTSPALVQTLLDRRDLLDRFGGAKQELTVYFSDIRGFTTVSEGLDPERLVELLNAYLSAQAEIVERNAGYVDKYVGDAIMAVWGAPVPDADHAARACKAALELRANLDRLRPEWKARFGVEIFARAGVNTCDAVAGNIGSVRKAQYTVLGDGVNLASRLEGANKAYGTEILVGDRTRQKAGDRFVFRTMDLLQVKGKNVGVPVFVLVAERGALSPEEEAWLAGWERAVAAYRARDFAGARAGFVALGAARPADEPCRVYVERCAAFLAAPPPAGWNGVYELHDK